MEPYPRPCAPVIIRPVQVLTSPRSARPPLGAVLVGTGVGAILLVGGLFLGWLVFATPVLSGLAPTGVRTSASQLAVGAAVWGFGLVAPASFAIVGALRLGLVARAVSAKSKPRATTRLVSAIDDEHTCANDVRLPDGRVVRNLILGPFGLAVLLELPPAHAMRHQGMSWEVRGPNGRWSHFENPLERAARDAERVRRWVASAERDFVVKVYAAVVTDDATIGRTTGCAVVRADEIPAWLTSLPRARALTEDRREGLIEEIRALL